MSGGDAAIALADVDVVRVAHVPGIEVVSAGVLTRAFPLHLSPQLGICVKSGDRHQVVANGGRVDFPPDAVCVRPPGCVWQSERGRHGFVSIDLDPELVGMDAEAVSFAAGGQMAFAARSALPHLPRVIKALGCASSRFEVESLVTGLVVGLADAGALSTFAERGSTTGGRAAVGVAREYLHQRVHLRPSLEDTARAAGTDKFTLLRAFRRELGTTPHAYLVMLRVGLAQRLLGDGRPIAEVAAEVGFADQAHLGRWFRRLSGVTPATYAATVRTAIAF